MFRFSILYGAILLWFITVSCTSQSDRLALLAFKNQIREDPLGALSSWNESVHYCQWNGVTCSLRHRDRVVVLDLTSQNLQGTFSPHVGNLSFLRGIILTNNSFHGEIPQELGRLSRLRVLALNNNSFSGEIPTNLTRCSNLRGIDLIENLLTGGVPPELSKLSKLIVLGIGKNELRGMIPTSLGNLSSLSTLSIAESRLVGSIPQDLCRIQGLGYLQLSMNRLNGMIPSCLYNLSQLTVLSLSGNQLSGTIPLDIGLTLPNLQELYLGQNKFTGSIPMSLTNASRLEVIGMEQNNFTGKVPHDLGKLQHLRRIYLHVNQLGSRLGDDLNFFTSLTNCTNFQALLIMENKLKGSLPSSIANLSTTLTSIRIDLNQIHGNIPSGMENLLNLSVLTASSNSIVGSIPEGISKLKNLKQLLLSVNRLTGRIPSSLGNLTQLTHLLLAENQLHGSIPSTLGNCRNLFEFDLSYNKLSGKIPSEVIGLSSIKTAFILSNNAFSGSLPVEVGNLTSLVIFDISENKLSGPIPDTLGNCFTLETLDMKGNVFEGTIPPSLQTLHGVEYLDLSRNKFSGPIPEYFAEFPSLTYLNLSFNEFEGQIPSNGVFRNSSSFSVVGNSKVCGGAVELKLPLCRFRTSKKQAKSLILKVVFPVVAASLCLLLLACLYFTRNQRKRSPENPVSESLPHKELLKISYGELYKVTNKFSTDNLVGVGSYGSVYKGVLNDAVFAVKVLNLQQQGASKSFLSECNALKNLRHRNLLKIITACSSIDFQGNDFKALVFEFMPKGSLEEWLHPKADEQGNSRSLSLLQRLNIAINIACALEYLHHLCQPAIIHCDLKPSNVLLDDDMIAHVADFGLAKIFADASNNSIQSQVSTNAIRGSIGYVAPEYGMGSAVSMQGDLYSYGILLLEMFMNKRPTNEMFVDGLSLHSFAKMSLPEKVMSIVDPMILREFEETINMHKPNTRLGQVQECLVSAMKLGVRCSNESPSERLDIRGVIAELYRIRDHYHSIEIDVE